MRFKVTDVSLQPLGESEYLRPARVCYTQGGVRKDWEVIRAHDSVAILIYHKSKDAFVLVYQFRPAVYLHNAEGFTYELCAGLIDKEKSTLQIAKEEIVEECGYDVPLEKIDRITAFHTSVGYAGSKQILYYAEVDESMRIHDGGGVDTEAIEVIDLPRDEAKHFLMDESKIKTPGLMYAIMWFFEHKNV